MRLEKAFDLLDDIESNGNIQNFIAQANSRYILFNVDEPRENFPDFTEHLDKRLSSISYTYLSIGCTLADNERFESASIAFEKGASILEYIHVPEPNRKEESQYFQLISALAYYAAFQYSKSFIVLKETEYSTKVSALVSSFLRKDFSKTLKYVSEILLSEEYTDSKVSEIDNDLKAKYRVYTYILAKSFAPLLEYIFSGNSKWLDQCKETLKDLLELIAIDREPAIWWVIRLLKFIIDGFSISSVWAVLRNHFEADEIPLLDRYTKSLAFGSPNITELFISQRLALDKVLSDNGAVVSLPTSSGKTRIAEITILQNLIEYDNSKILYLAPFRSLAFEIEESLSATFNPTGYRVSHLYGGGQFNKIDRSLIEDSRIIIATPEKAKAILRADDEISNSINLIVIDEGQLLGARQRETTNEIFIEELRYLIQQNSGKIVLLSAVLPNTKEFSKWITPTSDNIVTSDWRPSSQRFGILEWTGQNVNIRWKSKQDPEPFNLNFIDPFEIERPRSVRNFPDDKKSAIAATAVKLRSLGSVLIFVGRQNMVNSQAKEVLTALDGVDSAPHTWTNKNDWKMFELACNEAYGEESEILKYARNGIICHSAGLPSDVRSAMEKLMRDGNPQIIISTSTLAQGVNIGVSSVIIANVFIGRKPIDNKEFWNIAGRAGRAFADSEGKILYTIDRTKEPWQIRRDLGLTENYFNIDKLEHAESGVLFLVQQLFKIAEKCGIDEQTLLELVAENDYSAFIDSDGEDYSGLIEKKFDWIDDTLLSLNVKFESHKMEDPSGWIDDYFRNSLAYIQAVNDPSQEEENVISFFKARNNGVLKLAGDQENWKSYVTSGIPLRSSLIVEEHLETILEILNDYQTSEQTEDDLVTFLEKTEEITNKFPSEHFNNKYSTEEIDSIRNLWIKGNPMNDINRVTDNGFDICSQYFTFTLPWAINAIARKLNDSKLKDEAEVFSNLAMFVELGLPNYKAAKLYLSGIKSRVASTELASFLRFRKDISLSALREYLVNNIDDLKNKSSELLTNWLEVLKNKDSTNAKNIISTFEINYKKIEGVKRIFIREYNDEYYICSANFSYNEKVTIEDEELKEVANNLGIYFQYDDFIEGWKMKVRNPHLAVISQY